MSEKFDKIREMMQDLTDEEINEVAEKAQNISVTDLLTAAVLQKRQAKAEAETEKPDLVKLQEEYNTRKQGLRGNDLIMLKVEMRKRGLPIS